MGKGVRKNAGKGCGIVGKEFGNRVWERGLEEKGWGGEKGGVRGRGREYREWGRGGGKRERGREGVDPWGNQSGRSTVQQGFIALSGRD